MGVPAERGGDKLMPICAEKGCGLRVRFVGDVCSYCAYLAAKKSKTETVDPVEQPSHYKAGGLEAIQVIDAFGLGFNLGNVVKYVLRAGRKDPTKTLEDLRKARSYLNREIEKREREEA